MTEEEVVAKYPWITPSEESDDLVVAVAELVAIEAVRNTEAMLRRLTLESSPRAPDGRRWQ